MYIILNSLSIRIQLIILITSLSINVFAQEQRVKIYPFKSAIIEYKYEASFGGTHTKYIDDYGYKQTDIIRKILTFSDYDEKQFQTIILIGSKAYTIDYKDSTVAVGRNQTYRYYLENQDKKSTEVTDAIREVAFGYKLAGTKEYLKKDCKVWKSGKSMMLTYQGIELKSEVNFMTMMVEKATKVKINRKIPSGVFEIPQGLTYISSDTYQGFGGLTLNFDESAPNIETEDNSIDISFDTNDLQSSHNFIYFTEDGEMVSSKGVNEYNKIDNRLIKSQQKKMSANKVELDQTSTLIFKTNKGDLGKAQIKEKESDDFTFRYIVFNNDGSVKEHSTGVSKLLDKEFNISLNNSNNKLIITPIGKAKCFVLGW